MKISHIATAMTVGAIVMVSMASTSRAVGDKSIRLSGCLIRGDGDRDGYLLTSRGFEPSVRPSGDGHVIPGTIGTAGDYANIFYWLADNHNLRKHVGHLVEIEGSVKGDVKDGEMKITRKADWTELKVESDGRTINARVPHSSIVEGTDSRRKVDVLVRKIDVDDVRMLAANCP